MEQDLRLRQIARLLAAVAVTIGGGTVGFRLILHESWSQSVYRAVITATLTGLDTVPSTDGARALSIVMVLAGLTIIAYAGAVIVEAIAGGILTGVLAERRRERTIERLRDHFIICGYGRVGRRVADEFRAAGVPYVVLDFSAEAIANAKEHGDLLVEGNATEDEDLVARGPRARTGARRVLRLRRGQPLHHALGPQRRARAVHRRARLRRGRGEEAEARRRRPGRAPVRDGGPGDGEPRAQAAGDGVPRRRHDGGRARSPPRGDRGAGDVRPGRAARSARSASATRRARSSSRCARRTGASTRRRSRRR